MSLVDEDGLGRISATGRPDIWGDAPPEFGGSAERWSPEHLLLAATSLCLQLTFRRFARAKGIAIGRYESGIKGILDRTPQGPAFTSIVIAVALQVTEKESGLAVELLEKAKQHCIIAHALKPPVDLRINLSSR